MKLFSRKSLVAAAASTALFAGMVAAPAQAETTQPTSSTTASSTASPEPEDTEDETTDEPTEPADPTTPEQEEGSSEQLSSGSSNDEGNLDPGELRDWVAVFTAIIGALSTVFVFMERNF